jgi:hypothetical protein
MGGKIFGKQSTGAAEEEIANTFPNYLPRAKRIVYLFQSGGPSQLDMFDYKPLLDKYHGQDLPASVRQRPTPYRHECRPVNIAHYIITI